jgi:hypothetical protein
MTKNKKKNIVICSSASFYEKVVEVGGQLKSQGLKTIVPITATRMKRSKNFKVESYKTWMERPKDYRRKAYLTKRHFKEIAKGDIILVLNYKKNGKDGYIGGAVLSEMAIAFYLKKKIIILNSIDESSSLKEEIYGFMPIILNGNMGLIQKYSK